MKIKIKGKSFPGNHKWNINTVYFDIDEKPCEIDIMYVSNWKRNCFIDSLKTDATQKYIKKHYDCKWKDFQDCFLYELYEYSRHRNLLPVPYCDLSNYKYKE